jgi:hypothetical protein
MEDSFITLTYTNPIYGSLPVAVSYQFPVFCSSTRNPRESTYVCWNPEMAKRACRGLYLQKDDSLPGHGVRLSDLLVAHGGTSAPD